MKTSTNKTGFRASSHDVAKIRNLLAVGGDVDVSYSVAPNAMPASQEAAPYLGHARVAGACSQDELAEDMVKAGCQMNVEEIKRVWNGFGAYLLDRMPEAPRVFDLGFARFWPVIGGTFPASDAEFDPERNELYVAAAPSAAIRNALAGGTPTSTGVPAEASVIYNVQRQGTDVANTIRSGEPFWILGRNLTLGYGGEHAELELPDGGGTVPVTLEVQEDEDGSQRIVGRLAQPVDACEGAKLTLWTHGLTPGTELYPVHSDKLTVLAGEQTAPALTGINSPEQESPGIEWDAGIEMHGTGLALGSGDKVEAKREGDPSAQWYDLTGYVDGESSGAELIVLGGDAWEVLSRDVDLDADHTSARFRVTTGGGSAEIVATAIVP